MWSPDMPEGYASRKCRYRIASMCRGYGLDLSAADEKIIKSAIGIGPKNSKAELAIDLSANNALGIFADCAFDYVYDAHQLGNFTATDAVIAEWWRVIKPGGFLILYEQDKDYYPHVGTSGASPQRRRDLYWEDVWDVLNNFGNAEKVSASRHNESNEFSWQLIVRKEFASITDPIESLSPDPHTGQICLPRTKVTDKEALVIRCGALGDTIWVTPVFRKLKEECYHTVMCCTDYNAQVLKCNPNIDEYIIHHEATDIPYRELPNYWQDLAEGFEKVINLTQSIEGVLVKCEGSDEYTWPKEKRHAECNVNYVDRTMEIAGYPGMKGEKCELFFSDIEEELAKMYRHAREDKFIVLWGMSGSGFYKTYPWAEYVATEFALAHKDDVHIITVGDESCKILEWQNQVTANKCGVFTVRQSFIMTKYADLVVGPDTGILNAAGCYDTPKILLLSAASEENICKYWENVTPLSSGECECQPCHKLIYSNSCPKGTIAGIAPKCMEHLRPEDVLAAMEKVFQEWKTKRTLIVNEKRVCAFTLADSVLTHRLANRVKKSFEKFHPNIPFYIYDCADEKTLLGEVRESSCACKAFELRPRFCEMLMKDFDTVIYLDADTVVTGELTEFLMQDYDVAGSLNIGEAIYLNAGVAAVSSLEFCQEWTELMYRPDGGRSNQTHFNELANSGRYRLKIVDEKDVYYNERSRPYWKELRVDGEKLVCKGRIVKVLHFAGGVDRMESKLSSADFSDEVRIFLDAITGTHDFTTIKGEEVSAWK
ncbi:MAG: methyltransferase domain-containing protein [Dehalococcoidia bacterium]|nr:MAG: methyltransferase domain-containing protein [Dehalococcoidia bacterium]